jgi:hypothetical protein
VQRLVISRMQRAEYLQRRGVAPEVLEQEGSHPAEVVKNAAASLPAA